MNVNVIAETAEVSGGESAEADSCPVRACVFPEPVVRIREEHNISRRDIDPDALKVLYRLVRNNYTAYLVGGGVRDLLLGRKPKDFDISTNARPEQIRALFRNCILIGRRFRLAHIRYGEKIIETSTFRRTPEATCDPTDPEADLFQRDDNLFGTPQEDALRRDFTVNGLFYDIETFSIIDYVGGMEDLAAKRIRCIGDPCIRFREDPVRMIRAVRFASRLGFTLDPETEDAIKKHGEELAKASPARLLEEITRLFAFSSGEKAVRLLHQTDLLRVILPELSACLESDKCDHDLFWQRLRALDTGDTVLPDATPALIFSTLLMEPLQRRMERSWPAANFPRLRFDKVHSFLEPINQRLKFPRKLVDRIVHIYLSQYRFTHQGGGGKRGSIANFVTQDSFHESLALAEILLTAENASQSALNQWRDMLAERIYGREEGTSDGERRRGGGQQSHQHQPQQHHSSAAPNQEKEKNEAGQRDDGEELPGGNKLSRSARRRRNKRLKRQHRPQQPQAVAETATDSAENEDEAIGPAAAAFAVAEVSSPVQIEETVEPRVEAAPGDVAGKKAKAPRSRGGRGRSRRKDAQEEATAPAAEQSNPEQASAEGFQPLTAAAFYAAPPAPEKKEADEKKPKADEKKKASKGRGAKKKSDEAEKPEERKPLAPDRADEADTPMHWLDEI